MSFISSTYSFLFFFFSKSSPPFKISNQSINVSIYFHKRVNKFFFFFFPCWRLICASFLRIIINFWEFPSMLINAENLCIENMKFFFFQLSSMLHSTFPWSQFFTSSSTPLLTFHSVQILKSQFLQNPNPNPDKGFEQFL